MYASKHTQGERNNSKKTTCTGEKISGQLHDERDESKTDNRRVDGKDVHHCLLEIVEYPPAQPDSGDDRREVVIEQNERRRLLCDVGPLWPIATPMFAAFKAGASFTPSPVMATSSPRALSTRTSFSFCSGTIRAKMLHSPMRSWSSDSSIASSSGPVITVSAGSRPICRAIARAVPG